MEPKQLYLENGKPISPHLCGNCNRVWESRHSAERCCKCSYCGETCDWRVSVSHTECASKAMRDAEDKRLADAKLMPDYQGPFMFDEREVYRDIDELLDSIDPEDLPEFGFCVRYEAPRLDAERIIQAVAEDMHEEWESEGDGDFYLAVESWNEANRENGSYCETTKLKWSKENLLRIAEEQHEKQNVL